MKERRPAVMTAPKCQQMARRQGLRVGLQFHLEPHSTEGVVHLRGRADTGKALGYQAPAVSAVAPDAAPGRFRRNLPDPSPFGPMTLMATLADLKAALA